MEPGFNSGGIDEYIGISEGCMERFDIPAPIPVFISWFAGGEVFKRLLL